jgi:N-acetylglucosaminyldiphosphoundecaprenol N-acetyl-beta-D-mannosaminyltransferase
LISFLVKSVVNFRTVDILNVRVACLDFSGILDQVQNWLAEEERRTILYANAHSLNSACEDARLWSALSQADLVYADGISVVWASHILGGCRLIKMTGADWIWPFCAWAQDHGVSIYILAGRPGIGEKASQVLLQRYPNLKILGCADGFFRQASQAEVIREVNHLCPQVLFVGMGTPQQEQWLAAQRPALEVPVCWGVGALFDYIAGDERRVPAWMYTLGLEWFWRLWVDPRGKWRRYLLGNPRFTARVLRQRFQAGART